MSVEEAKERLASVRHSWSKAGVFMEGFKYTPAQEIVRADIQALDTILTAYEAREADSKRLDWLEFHRVSGLVQPLIDETTLQITRLIFGEYGYTAVRYAIDGAKKDIELIEYMRRSAALSCTEDTP